jgi:hypothetical protein
MQAVAQFQESLVDRIDLTVQRVLRGGPLGPIGGCNGSEFLQRKTWRSRNTGTVKRWARVSSA